MLLVFIVLYRTNICNDSKLYCRNIMTLHEGDGHYTKDPPWLLNTNQSLIHRLLLHREQGIMNMQ